MYPLHVTHYTGVNCLGAGVDAWSEALRAQRSGLVPCAFEDVALDTCIGRVEGVERAPVREDLQAFDCRSHRIAQLGLEQDGFAERVAAVRERYGADRIAVIMGTSTSGVLQTERAYQRRDPITGRLGADYQYATTQNTFALAAFVQRYLDLSGPTHVISTACSSSAKVFGAAARMIAGGFADAAVVGGADSLCLTTLYGFKSLELLSPAPCRPFDAGRNGISIGEGSGFALVERSVNPPRDATLLLGVGDSCDAHHMSTPHPEGAGAVLAMQRALAAAQLHPAAIGYVNLHGTATRSNDIAESHAVHAVFGDRVPCSATKGATGHLLGAAGITEAIIAMLSLREHWIPGTVNTRTIDRECACRVVIDGAASEYRYALSNSFGFGGNNCSLIFGCAHR